jgi:lipid-A-disaccharide synthase
VTTLLLVAGDASGDLHAADFVRAFRARHPDTRFVGLGGVQMREAGVELAVDQRDLAVGGLLELAGSLGSITSAWRRMGRVLAQVEPDLVVLVDSGGFNLPFARRVRRRRRRTPILYYVAPQVWAWRRRRIGKLERRVDRLAVIFPFEPEVYRHAALPVDFVGHPLVDRLAPVVEGLDRASARQQLDLDADAPLVALLPGSRDNEIRQHLPVQLEVAQLLHRADPRRRFAVALAPTVDLERVRARCGSADLPLHVIRGRTYEIIRAADVVLAKPGTVTVEAALLERPMVVLGRANPLTAVFLRRMVRVSWYSMPNLIAGERVVPEFLQEQARPELIAPAVAELFEGSAREAQLLALAKVSAGLGGGGAAGRAVDIAEEMLETRRA